VKSRNVYICAAIVEAMFAFLLQEMFRLLTYNAATAI
jgi:hypothetical protein